VTESRRSFTSGSDWFRRVDRSSIWIVLFCVGAAGMVWAHQQETPTTSRYTISGRVSDPLGLRPAEAVLRVGTHHDGGFSSSSVPTRADGTFVTRPLSPGTYVLEVVRTPHSAVAPATVVGFTMATVGTANVTGVTVEVRRDTAVHGRFRMESDNPAAPWPSSIVVNAILALEGAPLMRGTVADGAPGGRFVLRNAFGPSVVRPGWVGGSGGSWWLARILLNGTDITNVPTDFSNHPDAQLDVVFTQHPARFEGRVHDAEGRPLPGAWVLVCAADPKLREAWATTSHAVRADTKGTFRFATLPGRYFARAFVPDAFASRAVALRELAQVEQDGLAIEVRDRELQSVALKVREP